MIEVNAIHKNSKKQKILFASPNESNKCHFGMPIKSIKHLINLILLLSLLSLTACNGNLAGDVIDPSGNMTRKDYLALRHRGDPSDKNDADESLSDDSDDRANHKKENPPPIPSMPEILPPPTIDTKKPQKLISVTLTDDIPLRDFLVHIGREAEVNLAVDPRIQGGIIFTAHEKPFDEILKKICTLAGLRYTDEDDYIRIEIDEPYQKSYAIDYPSLSRQTTSEITISTNVFDSDTSGSKNNTGSGANNNSAAKILAQSSADFWAELERSLPKLLASSRRAQTNKFQQQQDSSQLPPEQSYSIDKQAGVVTLYGTDAQHKTITTYLEKLKHKATRQVLIEARIVEVELADGFQSGINWQTLFDKSANIAASLSAGGLITSAANGVFTASFGNTDFNGILKLVRSFGTTRVLSSPRLTVLNNQTAVLKVARNEVYFITQAQYSTTTNANGVPVSGTPVFSSTPHTVPVGLIMAVQPAIDPDRGIITMTLRPTISRVVNHVSDPSISLNAAGAGLKQSVDSRIPVLAVREMDSVLQLKSGEVAVMGGLMQDSSENKDQGLPPFDSMPLLGNLAKSRDNNGLTSELVILLRATIQNNPPPDDADKALYKKYSSDPRSIDFNLKQSSEP